MEKIIKEFENMLKVAELRALSKISLERPLNESEFKKMMKLKKYLIFLYPGLI